MATFNLGTITVTTAHRLDAEEAALRIEAMAAELARGALRDYGMTYRWTGTGRNRLSFECRKGKTSVSGNAEIGDGSARVTLRGVIEIGGIRGALANESQVRSSVREEIEKQLREAFRREVRLSATGMLAHVVRAAEARIAREVRYA